MTPDAFRDTLWRRQGEVIAGSPVAASRRVPGTTPRRDRAATVQVRAAARALVAAGRRAGVGNATGTEGRRHAPHHSTEGHGRACEAL